MHLPSLDYPQVYILYLSYFAGYFWLKRAQKNQESRFAELGVLTLVLAGLPVFFGGFYSWARFTSVNLGLFYFLAAQLRDRDFKKARARYALFLILALLILKLAQQTVQFGLGHWAG